MTSGEEFLRALGVEIAWQVECGEECAVYDHDGNRVEVCVHLPADELAEVFAEALALARLRMADSATAVGGKS
jgi:hypothetical protein